MKRSASLSRTFFRRPGIRELVPDLKLILTVLTVGCESHAGIYMPGGLAEDAGLDLSTLAGGLVDLERRGHIVRDGTTGEIFLTSFYRDNTFSSPQRQRQWSGDFARVESAVLRAAALAAIAASPECRLAVDKNGENKPNQQLANQGEGKGKGKGKEREATAASAADSESENRTALAGVKTKGGLQGKLDQLLASALRLGGDAARDEAVCLYIKRVAEHTSEGVVLDVIRECSLPSTARQAIVNAGLDKVAATACARAQAVDAEARRAAALAASAAVISKAAATGLPHTPKHVSKPKDPKFGRGGK